MELSQREIIEAGRCLIDIIDKAPALHALNGCAHSWSGTFVHSNSYLHAKSVIVEAEKVIESSNRRHTALGSCLRLSRKRSTKQCIGLADAHNRLNHRPVQCEGVRKIFFRLYRRLCRRDQSKLFPSR